MDGGDANRPALCVACRTVLAEGERCDVDPAHEVFPLGTERGRGEIASRAWGARRLRRRRELMDRAARVALWTGVALAGLAFGRAGYRALVLLLLGAAVALAIRWLRDRPVRDEPKARGATHRPRLPSAGSGLAGRVAEVHPGGRAPLGECAGGLVYLKLDGRHGGAVTFRDAFSLGFDVELEDGRTVHVPAGRIHLADKPGRQTLDHRQVDRYLRSLGIPETDDVVGRDPVPYHEAFGVVLARGTRVEVLGGVHPRDVDGAGSYRDAAGAALVADGVPMLRVLLG